MLVPARMVNEWIYCPRLAVLEWGHGEWAGNADTSAGRRSHRATEDGPAPALPSPEALDDDKKLKTRRLLLASEKLGLTAEIDILEAEDGEVTPVDIKAGKRPHVAEGAYLPERVQVITVDVTELGDTGIARGHLVDLIGEELPLESIGARAGTIGYEVLTRLGKRFHRVYVGEES